MALTPGGLPYPTGTDKVVDGDNAIKALAEAIDARVTGGLLVAVTGADGMIYVPAHGLGATPTRVGVSQLDQGAAQDPFSLVKLRVVNATGLGFIVYDTRTHTPFAGNQFSLYWWAQK
jgi:hypothetical protein